jgi:excisionase family DNA binding protein
MATPAARPLTRIDVMSTSEVADLLGIPHSTVYELARRGDLPARRVGPRRLLLRDGAAITPPDNPIPPQGDPESASDIVARVSDAAKRGCQGRGAGTVLRTAQPR